MTIKYKQELNPEETVKKMTLVEKLEYINGYKDFYIRPLLRFGLRGIKMADATLGLRDDFSVSTAFPAFISLAASWNSGLAASYGECVAREFNANGVDVLLGPGVNHYRVAQCSRNYEYTGEDPYLASRLVVPYIKAVQENGVAATVKHFVANNSDWQRKSSNSVIDKRTLEEIYLPPFKAAVKEAKTMAIMTSYNQINGEYGAENQELLQDTLIDEWGYKGLIMSDWWSNFHPIKSVRSPLHLEMPGNVALNPPIVKSMLESGTVEIADIDKKVKKVLEFVLDMQKLRSDNLHKGRYRCEEHLGTAKSIAEEGIVLLKNDQILPLPRNKKLNIFLIGPHAQKTPDGGGGAARVKAVNPYTIKTALIKTAELNNIELQLNESLEKIKKMDIVLLCLGLDDKKEAEGFDRPFELPREQLELIQQVKSLSDNVITIVTAGGGLDLTDVDEISRAVLHQWYPGEMGCLALSEIIFGLVNPSGKLPITIEKKFKDRPSSKNYLKPGQAHYTGWPNGSMNPINDLNYEEGIFSGYRHFVTREIKPLYAFGFGLSYSYFEYKDLVCQVNKNGGEVTLLIKNTSDFPGKETVQIYIRPLTPEVERPVYELKGFGKIELHAGEEKEIHISLDKLAFSFYHPEKNCWTVGYGEYEVLAAASSIDIKLIKQISI